MNIQSKIICIVKLNDKQTSCAMILNIKIIALNVCLSYNLTIDLNGKKDDLVNQLFYTANKNNSSTIVPNSERSMFFSRAISRKISIKSLFIIYHPYILL